ncbi:MAG: hypothetical protein ACM3KR_09600 [Deltaproteobacteria bacterium]
MNFKIPFKIINLENKRIEKRIIILSVICFSLLIVIQTLMMNPLARNLLTQEEKVEGVFLQKSTENIDKGTIVLELVDCNSMDKLWVMVNGQRVARFSGKKVTLTVSNNELIEIDSTGINASARVKIASFSKNIAFLINNSTLEVNKNIAVIARVKIKTAVSY